MPTQQLLYRSCLSSAYVRKRLATISNVRASPLILVLFCCFYLHVSAKSISLQTLSFNESLVSFAVFAPEPILPAFVSLHGRAIGASAFMPLQCSQVQYTISGNAVFLRCSVIAFTNLEVVASYDLPAPGNYRSPVVLASTGFPVTMITPPIAVQINDSSVLLQWSHVLDSPSPSMYVIFSQLVGFPFIRTDVPLGRFAHWVNGFLPKDVVNFVLMGCNRYSSSLQPHGLSCMNSSILRVALSSPPSPPNLSVQPLPNCKLLVSLHPVGGIHVTEYALTFSIDGVIMHQANTSLQNFTSPVISCSAAVLVEAAARNLHSAGFSTAASQSAYTQAVVPSPRSLMSRVSSDSVTFSWLKPHPFSDSWRYSIRCLVDGVSGCLTEAICNPVNDDVSYCLDDGEIVLEDDFYSFSRLHVGTNVTIFVQSIDALGFRSNESITATGVTGQRIHEMSAPTITSAVLLDSHCALILWNSDIPIIPSWSYLKLSAVAYSKAGVLVASVTFPLAESTVRLCSLPSGMTVSLLVILNTSLGDQVSSPVFVTTPATLPELRPALMFTRWVSWQAASLCIALTDASSVAVISSYDISCDDYFVAKLDPSLAQTIQVAFLFDVSNYTIHQIPGSLVNYSCFGVFWPIYVQPSSCSVAIINANTSVSAPTSTSYVKWQPAANFSVSSAVTIAGVTPSCIVLDVSSRGKMLQDAFMYVQSSESGSMLNIYQLPPFLLNSTLLMVNVCPMQFGISLNTPLYFRVYFANLNIRSELKQFSADAPLLKYPVFPRPYPSSPSELRLEFIDSDFVYVLFWTQPDSNMYLDGFQIMFTNTSTQDWSPLSAVVPQNQSSFVLNKLMKGTRYFFRIHSVSMQHYPPLNPSGSDVVSLSLDSIPDSVSNLIISSYLDDAISLSWNTVSYPRAAAFSLLCNSNAPNQSLISAVLSSNMASIRAEPFSSGICSVFACADMLCSRKSRPSYITYNLTSAPVPVTNLNVTSVLESSLSIEWSKSHYATEYMIIGTLSFNFVQQCECDAAKIFNCTICLVSHSVFSPIIIPSAQTSLNISGLKQGVVHFLFVFARSVSGARWIGNTSSVVAATPVPPPQSPPLYLSLVNISSSFAFIKWDSSQSPDAPTEYRVVVVPNGSLSNASVLFVTPSKPFASIVFRLKELLVGYKYSIFVKGRNNNIAAYNTSPLNEAALNISLVPPCFPPIRLNVVNVTTSSVFIDWEISSTGPEVLGILVFYYFYDVKMVPQPVLSYVHLPKIQRTYNFTELKSQQTYIFSVATIGYNADYSSSTISVISQSQQPFAGPPLNLSLLFVNETVFDMAWNAPSLLVQPKFLVSVPPISYEIYVCYKSCMTADVFPQTARPNDVFVDSYGDLFRWTGLEWATVLPLVNSYTFVASVSSSTRSFSYDFVNISSLFARVCAYNLNRQLAPSKANCAYLRNIRVQGLAPTPLLVAGTNPTITTISLNWVVSCPQSQTDCLQGAFFAIQFSIFGSGIWTDYSETSTISSMTVKNMFPGTTYVFRVSSINHAGKSPWSEPSQPSPASTTYNTPKNIRVSGISRSSGSRSVTVALYWDALPNIALHIFKVEYQVPGLVGWNLATAATNGSRFSANVPDIRYFGSNGSAIAINGSYPFAPYQFRITGGTEKYGIDPVDVSSSISVILPALPLLPPALTSLSVTSNSNSSASFAIAAPLISQPMLGLSSQLFFRAFISSNEFSSGLNNFDDTRAVFRDQWSYPAYSSALAFQIDGLMMNVTYSLRVQTITANISVASEFSTLRFQLAPVPGPPLNLSVTSVSLNSVTIAWSPPGGAVSGYLLQYSVNSSVFQSAGDVGMSSEGTIRKLPSRTAIVIAVRARSLHSDGYGTAVMLLAYPTLSCDAETSLNLLWANVTHAKLVWTQGNSLCVRVQQLQVFSEGLWITYGNAVNSVANSSVIPCFATKVLQVRRISFSYNIQDLGTVSSVVSVFCVQSPLPVYNLVVLETFGTSLVLQFDHDVDPNGMSYFRVDTHCPISAFHSSIVHQVGKGLNEKHVRLIAAQLPKSTPCQCIVYHGNSHSSGIESTGSSTRFFSLEPPIDWLPQNISLVGYVLMSKNYADVTLSYVLKYPENVSFVGVFLVTDDVVLIYEEPVATALMQITTPNISSSFRSCLAVLCRNLNSLGYVTRFNINKEQVVCVTPDIGNPVVDVKIVAASFDPVPSVDVVCTVVSATKFVRLLLFKTLNDPTPFYFVDRAWAINNSNSQPVSLLSLSSPLDVKLQYIMPNISVGDEPVYLCLQPWNYDASASSPCVRRMLYFKPVNSGAFLSVAVSIKPDRRIQLRIRLSLGHSATILVVTVFPCLLNAEISSDSLNFYTANFSLPYCTSNCETVFEIPPMFQRRCYELHSRLYNRDINVITKFSRCDYQSSCKSVIFSVPAIPLTTIRSAHLSRVFLNNTFDFAVLLSSPAVGWLCIRVSSHIPFSGLKSCNSYVVTNSGTVEYNLFLPYSPYSITDVSQGFDIGLFDILEKTLAVETLNVSLPSFPLKAPSFVFSSFFNNASTASLSLNVNLMELSLPTRFHATVWPARNSFCGGILKNGLVPCIGSQSFMVASSPIIMNNLVPSQQYCISLRYQNAVGWSPWSDDNCSVVASSVPFLRTLMIGSNDSTAVVFVAAKMFATFINLRIDAAHFSANIDASTIGSSDFQPQTQWFLSLTHPERSFLLPLLMNGAERSVDFTFTGFITVQRPQRSLPFLLNIQVTDESGNFSLHTVYLGLCRVVSPPVSAYIRKLSSFESDLRFSMSPSYAADVVGYEIRCSWPDASAGSLCNCSQCEPSTLLVPLSSAQSRSFILKLYYNSSICPTVFVRTLGFASHSDFIQVGVSDDPAPLSISNCPDLEYIAVLEAAFLDQDTGDIMVQKPQILVNYSVNVEVSLSAASEWIPVSSVLRGKFLIVRVESSQQVMFVRLRAVDSLSCVLFSTSISVEMLPPLSVNFPAYRVSIKQSSVYIGWAPVHSSSCSPFFEVATAQPCPQVWIKIVSDDLVNDGAQPRLGVSLPTLRSMLFASRLGATMTLDDVGIVNASSCMNWFALRAVCSKLPLVFDLNKRLPLINFPQTINSTLVCEIDSYSNSVITAKVSGWTKFDAANFGASWIVLSNAGALSGHANDMLTISSVLVDQKGFVYLSFHHEYPVMAFLRLQIIFQRFDEILAGQTTLQLMPPPLSPAISWYYVSSSTLRVSWTADQYSQITQHRVRLSADGDITDFREFFTNLSFVDITSVSPNVTYRIFASARNRHIAGFVFQSETVALFALAVPQPKCLSIVQYSAGGVVISWCNPQYSQSLYAVITASIQSSCFPVNVDARIFVDPFRPMAILYGLNESVYDVSVGFKTQDKKLSPPSHLKIHPASSSCKCRVNVSLGSSNMQVYPCQDYFLKNVKIRFVSGSVSSEIPVSSTSFYVTEVPKGSLLSGLYVISCVSEYYSGAVAVGPSWTLNVPVAPVDDLKVVFANSSLISLAFQSTALQSTFNVSIKDRTSNIFSNFSTAHKYISIAAAAGRVYDVWVTVLSANSSSDSKNIVVSAVNATSVISPVLSLTGIFDTSIAVSWIPPAAVQIAAAGMFRYELAFASISDSGIILPFLSGLNLSNPAVTAVVNLPLQLRSYAIRLSVCVTGMDVCQIQMNCSSGMRNIESGCLMAMTSPRPPPPATVSMGLYSRSLRDSRMIQVPVTWFPGSALPVLSYRVTLSCDPCPAGSIIQDTGSPITNSATAVLLNVTTNSTNLILDLIPNSSLLLLRLELSALGINTIGFGTTSVVQFTPALSCSALPRCAPNLVTIASANISSITLLLSPSPCGSNFDIEAAINGGGFYPVAPTTSGILSPLVQVTSIGGTPYFASSDFVIFRYSVRAISGVICMEPGYFNTSLIIFSGTLNFGQYFQAPSYSTLQVVRVTSDSSVVSVTGAFVGNGMFATLMLILRDRSGGLVASVATKRDDLVQFSNLPPNETLYLEICSVPVDGRSSACTVSSANTIPVFLHDPLPAPSVIVSNLTSGLAGFFAIGSCTSFANSLQVIGMVNDTVAINMSFPNLCPVTIPPIIFPFCGTWILKMLWLSAAGPGNFLSFTLNISDHLRPPESVFADVIIGPFEIPSVRISWQPPYLDACSTGPELPITGYNVACTVNGMPSTVRVSSASRSVVLPLGLNVHVGMNVVVSVQSIQTRDDLLVVMSRPAIVNASLFACDDSAVEIVADILQPPLAPCRIQTAITIYSGPVSFLPGLLVPFKRMPSSIAPEMQGKLLNVTILSCGFGTCALLHMPQPGPVGAVSSVCIRVVSQGVIVTWCMKVQFKLPLPVLSSSSQSPLFTGVFCNVDVSVSAFGHSRLPKPVLSLSNFTKSSMLRTVVSNSSASLPEGMSIQYIDYQRATVSWNVQLGQQGFLYMLCFAARYPFPSDGVMFASSHLCVSISARPCSACVTSRYSIAAMASLWNTDWVATWSSTPSSALINGTVVAFGPTIIAARDDSGDGRFFANRMGCSISDLMLWNPHAGDIPNSPMQQPVSFVAIFVLSIFI